MPYKHIKKKIPPDLDRRRVIPLKDHEYIRYRYFEKHEAIRAIARDYAPHEVRRVIQFILFPERLEHHKTLYKERRKDEILQKRRPHKSNAST